MTIIKRYALPLIVMCNVVVALLHYLDFLQIINGFRPEGYASIDTLHLLMGPIALIGLCLVWAQRPITSAILLSAYASMSLLAVHQMNHIQVILQITDSANIHTSLYWAQVCLATVLILWVILGTLHTPPQPISQTQENLGNERGEILPMRASSQNTNSATPMAPIVQSATALAFRRSESDRADAMGDPAKTHKAAA